VGEGSFPILDTNKRPLEVLLGNRAFFISDTGILPFSADNVLLPAYEQDGGRFGYGIFSIYSA
jgi:hypothetical protein